MSVNVRSVCTLFTELVDYRSFLEKHGCDFDALVCCPGTNATLLEEYAMTACNTSGVCDGDGITEWIPLIVIGVVLFALLCTAFVQELPVRGRREGGGAADEGITAPIIVSQ